MLLNWSSTTTRYYWITFSFGRPYRGGVSTHDCCPTGRTGRFRPTSPRMVRGGLTRKTLTKTSTRSTLHPIRSYYRSFQSERSACDPTTSPPPPDLTLAGPQPGQLGFFWALTAKCVPSLCVRDTMCCLFLSGLPSC